MLIHSLARTPTHTNFEIEYNLSFHFLFLSVSSLLKVVSAMKQGRNIQEPETGVNSTSAVIC